MPYDKATDAPARFQFESNSAPSQSANCGPTCVVKIAQYYMDTWWGIEATRRTISGMGPYYVNGRWVWGAPAYMPTSPAQQRDMLSKRGVASTIIRIDSLYQMRQIVAGGRRPILIGLYMARVPYNYRDHPFTGWHAVVVMDTAVVGGTSGFWVMDPNFSPHGGIRPDPDRGKKFYPDWVMQYAYISNYSRWAIVPNRSKRTTTLPKPAPPISEALPVKFKSPDHPSWITLKPKAEVRRAPDFSSPIIMTISWRGAGPYPLVGYTTGDLYKVDATRRSNSWSIYRINNNKTTDSYDGQFGYVPTHYARITRA